MLVAETEIYLNYLATIKLPRPISSSTGRNMPGQ